MVFSRDMVALGELQWHFYAVMVMVSLSYAQKEDAHVRVDLFHRLFSPRAKRFIEIVGILVFFVPLFAIIFWYGCEFTHDAFRIGEKITLTGRPPLALGDQGLYPYRRRPPPPQLRRPRRPPLHRILPGRSLSPIRFRLFPQH